MAAQKTAPSVAGLRRLGRRWRKAALVVHILTAGAWIGIDVIVAVLVVAGRYGSTPTQALAYQALGTFAVGPMLAAGLLCLATGLALGLGTKWGLARYWWVLVKLVLTVVLCVLIVVALRPGMADVVAWGQSLPSSAVRPRAIDTLAFPPIVSLSALTLATSLAVIKPWGRTRKGR